MSLYGIPKMLQRFRTCSTDENGKLEQCTDFTMFTAIKVLDVDTNNGIDFELDIENGSRICSVTDSDYYNSNVKICEVLIL